MTAPLHTPQCMGRSFLIGSLFNKYEFNIQNENIISFWAKGQKQFIYTIELKPKQMYDVHTFLMPPRPIGKQFGQTFICAHKKLLMLLVRGLINMYKCAHQEKIYFYISSL